MPNYVGKRAASVKGARLGYAGKSTVNWDKFDQSTSSSEEEPPEPEPVVVEPVPKKPELPQLRKADPRDKDSFRPMRGRELQLAQQLSESRLGREDDYNGNAEHTYKPRVTHLSSDDVYNRRHNHDWDRQLKAGHYHGAQAISSGDVFGEQESTFDYLAGKLKAAKKTVTEALSDITES